MLTICFGNKETFAIEVTGDHADVYATGARLNPENEPLHLPFARNSLAMLAMKLMEANTLTYFAPLFSGLTIEEAFQNLASPQSPPYRRASDKLRVDDLGFMATDHLCFLIPVVDEFYPVDFHVSPTFNFTRKPKAGEPQNELRIVSGLVSGTEIRSAVVNPYEMIRTIALARNAHTIQETYSETSKPELIPLLAALEYDTRKEREKLDDWLDDIYRQREEQRLFSITDDDTYEEREDLRFTPEIDIEYPNWSELEKFIGSIFESALLPYLPPKTIDSILFFISRSEECGRIITWLHPKKGGPFSYCGNLNYEDFLFLCLEALKRPDDFCDYQLVACFEKLESLTDFEATLLSRFFDEKKDSYTRRRVLGIFDHFKMPQTLDLVQRLWETDECEFVKHHCLHILKEHPEGEELFRQYLKEYLGKFDLTVDKDRENFITHLLTPDPEDK